METQEETTEDFDCPICEDKGYILKLDWVNDDEDYETMHKCVCQEE